MTCYGAKELAESFRTVRNNTIQIAEDIPEERYGYRVTPETRSVAEMFGHVALATRFAERIHFTDRLHTFAGFDYFPFREKLTAEENRRRTKAEILDLLRTEGDKFARLLEGVSEDFLAERVESAPGFQPPSRSRFEMLLAVKEHEMHHRAQLMVIERMLGITPHLTRRMEQRIAELRANRAAS